MMYTNEEIEILRDNTRQIEAYLRTLMPKLRETVTVEFGDMTTRRGDFGFPVKEMQYEIHVGKNCLCGHSGGLRYDFVDANVRSDYSVSIYSKGYSDYMAKLTRDWRKIKYELLNALDKQTAQVATIKSFKL